MSRDVRPNEVTALRQYLYAAGWEQASSGAAGTFWRLGRVQVAVPFATERLPRSIWASLLSRVADATDGLTREKLELQLAGGETSSDVAWLRVGVPSDESVPLDAGLALVTSVQRMLRAAATTAQRTRAQIGGRYSLVGDDIASRARMGHTVPGSYVVPVLLPVSEPGPIPAASEQGAFDVARVQKEPEERRVMRTLAESLRAVVGNVVEAKGVTSQVVHQLVPAGVTREQLLCIAAVLSSREVNELSASFDWAPTYRAPASAGEPLVIPAEAADRIETAASFMRSRRVSALETFSGPVIEIRQEPGDERGWITLQTIRRGRAAEVRVTAGPKVIESAHKWMQQAETVVAVGSISSAPGRPLEIRKPDSVYPLSEGMLSPG